MRSHKRILYDKLNKANSALNDAQDALDRARLAYNDVEYKLIAECRSFDAMVTYVSEQQNGGRQKSEE